MELRICILSDYAGVKDEGMRAVAFYLMRELSKRHYVSNLEVAKIFSSKFWSSLRSFTPDIIHFIPGPTIYSFIIVKALKASCPKSKSVMSVNLPVLSALSKSFIRALRPDMLLTQSRESEDMFIKLGFRTTFLPNGVDVDIFRPVSSKEKLRLRKKYGFEENKPLVIHVGSIRRIRNILLFSEMSKKFDCNFLVVGSTSLPQESDVYDALKKSGCRVINWYVESIEDLYQMADCYIFPVFNRLSSVEIPLSVLEAMACNLPVITTKFGGLPRIFDGDGGILYAEKQDDFNFLLERVLSGKLSVDTRKMVLPYSWKRVSEKLEKIYDALIYE